MHVEDHHHVRLSKLEESDDVESSSRGQGWRFTIANVVNTFRLQEQIVCTIFHNLCSHGNGLRES